MKMVAGLAGAAALAAIGHAAFCQTSAAQGAQAAVTPMAAKPSRPSAAAALTVLQDVCLPLLQGRDLKTVAGAAGLKLRDGQWILPIDARRRVELTPPDSVNPHVCSATIIHSVGGQGAILASLNNWTKSQAPPLQPIKVQESSKGVNYVRTTSSWGAQTPKGSEGLVFSQEKTLSGQPVLKQFDQSDLLLSLTPS